VPTAVGTSYERVVRQGELNHFEKLAQVTTPQVMHFLYALTLLTWVNPGRCVPGHWLFELYRTLAERDGTDIRPED
jgi:hypothetical protein